MDFTNIPFGLAYADNQEIREGDIASYYEADSMSGNVVVHFYWDAYSFSFKAMPLNERGVDGPWSLVGSRDRKFTRLGNIYDSPEVFPLWKMAGRIESEMNLMRQTIPYSCFPLAVMNACIGKGIEKAQMNLDVLKRLIDIGECRKWGGCIDEQGVLDVVRAEFQSTFVLDEDYTSVVENGGVISVVGHHAVAAVVRDGTSFLVNMLGYPFVVPARLVKIPRSEDRSYHRDYTILLS